MNVRGKDTGLGTVTVIAVGAALVVLYIGAGVTLAIGPPWRLTLLVRRRRPTSQQRGMTRGSSGWRL